MVKVGIVGTGFVGLTHAAVTARDNHVVAYDINKKKIDDFSSGEKNRIERHIHERGLAELVAEQIRARRLSFTINPRDLIHSEVFFMCLPTPYKPSGESDLTFLFNAAGTIGDALKERKEQSFVLFVDKSTVPIGTAKLFSNYLGGLGLENFTVASNPEFLPEGDAVNSAIHPPKVIVGSKDPEALDLLRKLYSGFYNNPNTEYIECDPETSEAIKYISNAMLYSQIVLWQALGGRICEVFPEIDFETLRRGIIADPRIAKWGSYVSAGAGGSCFRKDMLSLAYQMNKLGADNSLPILIDQINEFQKIYMIERAEKEAGFSFSNKMVAMLGAAFKQGTNDVRESNVLTMIPELLGRGVCNINVYDPLALEEAKRHFDPGQNELFRRLSYYKSVEDALVGTDVAIIATDHQEFRGLVDILMKTVKKLYLLIDGRRMIPKQGVTTLVDNGISYLPVGGTYKTK